MTIRKHGLRTLVLGLVVASGVALAPSAFARGHLSIGINLPGLSLGYWGGHRGHGYVDIGGYYGGGYYGGGYYDGGYYALRTTRRRRCTTIRIIPMRRRIVATIRVLRITATAIVRAITIVGMTAATTAAGMTVAPTGAATITAAPIRVIGTESIRRQFSRHKARNNVRCGPLLVRMLAGLGLRR